MTDLLIYLSSPRSLIDRAGIEEAKEGGRLLKEAGFTFDKAYTSMLRRAIKTCWLVLEEASCLLCPWLSRFNLKSARTTLACLG